ncbi:DUF4974 domain-containing protein [Ancylomarina salipaludis]|uniref:DUF4974 domain-containing protein n=1 Tax=Ancylomarina salipaludis TaxID=2501299 RepID=A0A4Q1JI47_9BACT|nr:FecR family protein [Ancylomarina salipaludis]RXQ88051.1 DUF4974 domain-containing protein [Ancylomarina salipaludis]
MQTPNYKISKLIVRYLNGQLNDEQEQELNQWLETPLHRNLFEKIVTKENILKMSFEYDGCDLDKAWTKIEKQLLNKHLLQHWLAYAAILILPIAIGFLILTQNPQYDEVMTETTTIVPGSSHAILYFANGDVVDLKVDTSMLIRTKDHLLVRKDDEKLSINSDSLLSNKLTRLNKIVTPIGGEYQVELPDGTKVWLNADSYLEFPSVFADNQRKVIAKGELYFDVAKDEAKPFIVESQGMNLKVLGTEFNLRSYADENQVISTLVEGSVEVKNALGDGRILVPGKQVHIQKSDNSMQVSQANIESVIAWKNGRFIFDNRRLEDIMYDLARWYDVKIFFGNSSVKEAHFSVDVLRYGEIESILSLIEGTGDASFVIKGNVITVN